MSQHRHFRVYRDGAGNLVTRGGPVFGGSPSLKGETMRYDDFGLELVEDDLGAMDYASLGAYDDFAAMDYPSLGAAQRYLPRGPRHLMRPPVSARRPTPQVVQKTILTGTTGNAVTAGAATVTIRPQFDFVAEDISFTGSVTNAGAGSTGWFITSIDFGDRIVFSNAQGVPLALFGTGSFIRGLVKGAAIAAGLDIAITGTNNVAGNTTTASTLLVQVIGLKRGTSGCGPGAV